VPRPDNKAPPLGAVLPDKAVATTKDRGARRRAGQTSAPVRAPHGLGYGVTNGSANAHGSPSPRFKK
jgi:hypothetical protein